MLHLFKSMCYWVNVFSGHVHVYVLWGRGVNVASVHVYVYVLRDGVGEGVNVASVHIHLYVLGGGRSMLPLFMPMCMCFVGGQCCICYGKDPCIVSLTRFSYAKVFVRAKIKIKPNN